MPITYRVDAERQTVRVKGTEPLTAEDLERYFRETRADARILPSADRLFDIRGVTTVPSTADLARIARDLRESGGLPEGRVAVLVDSDLTHGVARMFSGFAGLGQKVQVFRTETGAADWAERGILIDD